MLAIFGMVTFSITFIIWQYNLSVIRAIAFGISLYILCFSVIGSLLSIFDLFSLVHINIILLLPILFAIVYYHEHLFNYKSKYPRFIFFKEDYYILLAAIIALPFIYKRIEFFTVYADAAVYISYAKNLILTGGSNLAEKASLVPNLSGKMLSTYLSDHYNHASSYLPGIYCTEYKDCYYQFFPGWPAVLALGANLFGQANLLFIMIILSLLTIYWFGVILSFYIQNFLLFLLTLAFGTSTLFVYFSKYSTSELFLLMIVLLIISTLLSRLSNNSILLLISFSACAYFFTHISSFLYFLPLLVLLNVYFIFNNDPLCAKIVQIASLLYLISLVAGHYFSPQYYYDIYALNLGLANIQGISPYMGPIFIGGTVILLNITPYVIRITFTKFKRI